jgi:hypothetical protein
MTYIILRSEVTQGLPSVVKRTWGVLESAMPQWTRETVPRFSVPPHLRKFWESAANCYVLILSHVETIKCELAEESNCFNKKTSQHMLPVADTQ